MNGVTPIAEHVLDLYATFRFSPPSGQYTILAAFVLENASADHTISIGTGSKCLPTAQFSVTGDALHDSHAEVLARRGAMLWLYEEMDRHENSGSAWIELGSHGKYRLKVGTQLYLYVSTVPCQFGLNILASNQYIHLPIFKFVE